MTVGNAAALRWRFAVLQYGQATPQGTMTHTERGFLAYLLCTLPIVAGVLLMGFDNARQLERCEATGRGQAECRLLVLGR